MTQKDNWIAEKLLAQEEQLMHDLAAKRFKDASGATDVAPPAQAIPIDPAVEQAAFNELLAFIATNPEDDCEFTALTPEEFAAEAFTPPATNSEE